MHMSFRSRCLLCSIFCLSYHAHSSVDSIPDNQAKKASNKETSKISQMAHLSSEDINDHFDDLNVIAKKNVMTLADALIAAYDNNSTLQKTRREVLASHSKVTQAKAGFMPTIDAVANISGKRSKYDNDPQPPYSQSQSSRSHGLGAGLQLTQNLFAGGETYASVMAADQNMRASWAGLMAAEQKVFSDVIKAYIDLITKLSTVNVRKAYRTAQQKNYDTSYEKHKIGEETVTQVAIAEANLMSADAELRNAESAVEGAKAAFVLQTGVNPGDLKAPLEPTGLPSSLDKALKIAFDNNPNILQAKFTHNVSKAELNKANAQFFSPKINLEASLGRDSNNARSQQLALNNQGQYSPNESRLWNRSVNHQVAVKMQYNLFSGGSYSSQRRAAHDTALSKRFAIEETKNTIQSNLVATYATMVAAKENIENFKKQVKAAEISVNATRQELEVGTKVLKDVLDQEYNLVKAQISQLEAENTYYTAAYKIVELLGGLHSKALKLDVAYFDPKKFYDESILGF